MSLLDYLTTPNPSISARDSAPVSDGRNRKSKSKRNTENSAYTAPVWIKRWEEFDLVTLSEMYPQLLQNKRRRRPDFAETDSLFEEVWNEASVQSVIKDWNARVVCEALKETQEVLGHEYRIYMVLGCWAQPLGSGSGSRPFYPDWAAVNKDKSWKPGRRAAPESIMPGDTKISTGWRSSEIREGSTRFPPSGRPNWFKPLAQIFSYCSKAHARYGYLITDKELVVVRIGPHTDAPRENGPVTVDQKFNQTDQTGCLEFATVTWAHEEGNNTSLTVNLALWWLHLLAAKDNSIQWEYPPLKEEILPRPEQPPHHYADCQQKDGDTEPDTEGDDPIPGDQNDRDIGSFNVNAGDDLDSFKVPDTTKLVTRARKRSRTDQHHGNKKKVKALDRVDEGN